MNGKNIIFLLSAFTFLISSCVNYKTQVNVPTKMTKYQMKDLFETFFPKDLAITRVTSKGVKLIIKNKILFDFNSYRLSSRAKRFLKQFAYIYKCKIEPEYPDSKIVVIGYTDDIGDENYNQKLSLKRAQAVKDFLMNLDILSIAPEKIIAIGKGEKDPIVPNTNAKNRALNRRVEILINLNSGDKSAQ